MLFRHDITMVALRSFDLNGGFGVSGAVEPEAWATGVPTVAAAVDDGTLDDAEESWCGDDGLE